LWAHSSRFDIGRLGDRVDAVGLKSHVARCPYLILVAQQRGSYTYIV
jgi:hypothetical protein